MPQIEVAFDIDADGILHVTAKDLSSGREQKIRIEAKSGLHEEDIQRMVKDAELHADEDKKKREEVEIKNEADSLMFRAIKALEEVKDKLPKDVVDDVQSKVDAMKTALDSNDLGRIKTAKTDLERHMQHIGEAMAKAGSAGGPQQPHAAPQPDFSQAAQGGPSQQPHHEPPKSDDKDNIEEAEVEISTMIRSLKADGERDRSDPFPY